MGLDLGQVFPAPLGLAPPWVSAQPVGFVLCWGFDLQWVCSGFDLRWVVVVVVVVEVDFLCCWWVEVDGVLLNLLAWLWVLAVGFCGFLSSV